MKELTQSTTGVRESLGRVTFILSVLVLFTSMLDLFVNRLLFRSGPEMFAHIQIPGLADVSAIGAISFNFEQMILYVILSSAAVILVRQSEAFPRYLGLVLVPQMISAGLLYLSLPLEVVWALSMVLVLTTGVEVFGLIAFRSSKPGAVKGSRRVAEMLFLGMLGLSFLFPIYYRLSTLIGSIGLASIPFAMDAYSAAIFAIMGVSVAAFAYSLATPAPNFKMTIFTFVKVAIIPALLVFPMLYGLMESFFMTQLFGLVIAMSTDITLSFNMVRAIFLASFFLLTSVSLLIWKGRKSGDWFLLQQGMGLILILSTTFLFTYPNYLLLGTTGALLICYPLTKK
jgi:hypothetical protein